MQKNLNFFRGGGVQADAICNKPTRGGLIITSPYCVNVCFSRTADSRHYWQEIAPGHTNQQCKKGIAPDSSDALNPRLSP